MRKQCSKCHDESSGNDSYMSETPPWTMYVTMSETLKVKEICKGGSGLGRDTRHKKQHKGEPPTTSTRDRHTSAARTESNVW